MGDKKMDMKNHVPSIRQDQMATAIEDAQTMLNCVLVVKKLLHEDKAIQLPGNEVIFSEERLNRVIKAMDFKESDEYKARQEQIEKNNKA